MSAYKASCYFSKSFFAISLPNHTFPDLASYQCIYRAGTHKNSKNKEAVAKRYATTSDSSVLLSCVYTLGAV